MAGTYKAVFIVLRKRYHYCIINTFIFAIRKINKFPK